MTGECVRKETVRLVIVTVAGRRLLIVRLVTIRVFVLRMVTVSDWCKTSD